MKNKKTQQTFDESMFEKEVYNSLKYYGLLFPESTKDVERFEEFYGDTEIEAPTSNELFNKGKNAGIIEMESTLSSNLGMAAYAPAEDPLFGADDMQQDKKNEPFSDSKNEDDASKK